MQEIRAMDAQDSRLQDEVKKGLWSFEPEEAWADAPAEVGENGDGGKAEENALSECRWEMLGSRSAAMCGLGRAWT